jgi:hypothetical protein
MSKHHGQWQAQGKDIKDPHKGYRREWGQDTVPTKPQGLGWLDEVAEMCTASEFRRREVGGFRAAEKFVKRAPPDGYPTMMRSFYAKDDRYPNARVDLEIYGMAFADQT